MGKVEAGPLELPPVRRWISGMPWSAVGVNRNRVLSGQNGAGVRESRESGSHDGIRGALQNHHGEQEWGESSNGTQPFVNAQKDEMQ